MYHQNWYSTQWGSLLFFLFFDDFFTKNLTFLPDNPVWFYTKNSQKVNFSSNFDYNTGNFIDFFSQKKWFFPQNAHAYRALIWLFWTIIQCVFTPKIPKTFTFPQIAPIIQGILLTFLPKKVFFFSKCACISSTILTFLPNYPVCFYTKNFQKVKFSSNFDYNTGHFIDFSPKKSDFLSKCDCISSTILTFLPNNPVCFYNKNSQKVNFSSNYANNTVHFIDFSPKESDLFLKMRMHIKHYFDFFAR